MFELQSTFRTAEGRANLSAAIENGLTVIFEQLLTDKTLLINNTKTRQINKIQRTIRIRKLLNNLKDKIKTRTTIRINIMTNTIKMINTIIIMIINTIRITIRTITFNQLIIS